MSNMNYDARERTRFENRQAQREIHKELVNSDINRRVFDCVDNGFLRVATAAGFKKKARNRK